MTIYHVSAPMVPGAKPTHHACLTLAEARKYAKEHFGHRKDLTYQDVVITVTYENGKQRHEYAGYGLK